MKIFNFRVACVKGYVYMSIRAYDISAAILAVMMEGHYRSEITLV